MNIMKVPSCKNSSRNTLVCFQEESLSECIVMVFQCMYIINVTLHKNDYENWPNTFSQNFNSKYIFSKLTWYSYGNYNNIQAQTENLLKLQAIWIFIGSGLGY